MIGVKPKVQSTLMVESVANKAFIVPINLEAQNKNSLVDCMVDTDSFVSLINYSLVKCFNIENIEATRYCLDGVKVQSLFWIRQFHISICLSDFISKGNVKTFISWE